MSSKFNEVKYFYKTGLWSKIQTKNAVRKKWITADEYKEITGEEYTE